MLIKLAIVDVDTLLALAPEELAWYVMDHALTVRQNQNLHIQDVFSDRLFEPPNAYPQSRRDEVELAITEAWEWLKTHLVIVPLLGSNGTHGWMRLSRRGQSLRSDKHFEGFRKTAAFPKQLLHPLIAEKVWLALIRGDLEDAVFMAFKTVEVQVREAARLEANDIGVALMRKAFDKTAGALTDQSAPEGERDALAHLFAGAIGSYKNPYSHRTVTISDASEAQEMTMLASHLLRIVDARRKS